MKFLRNKDNNSATHDTDLDLIFPILIVRKVERLSPRPIPWTERAGQAILPGKDIFSEVPSVLGLLLGVGIQVFLWVYFRFPWIRRIEHVQNICAGKGVNVSIEYWIH
jgi:hypothetical protein